MEYLQHIITDWTPLLQQYGYIILALFIAIEGMGVPAPGQSLLIVASIIAISGAMSLPLVLIVATISAFIGNTAGYFIGIKFGHILTDKHWIKPKTLDKLHGFIERHGTGALVLSRFIEGVKQFMCLGCGIAQMPLKQFLIGNTAAVAVWVLVFGVAPAYLYDEVGPIMGFYHHHQLAFLAAGSLLLLIVLGFIIKKLTRKSQP